MDLLKNFKLASKLRIIILMLVVGSLIFGITAYLTIEKLRVNGEMYSEIVEGKDLIADILPPPNFIVETYLNSFLMLRADKNELNELVEKSKSLSEEYYTRHKFWVKTLEDGKLKDDMVENSFKPAKEFFELRDSKFIPLIREGNIAEAENLLNTKMKELFHAHKVYIESVVEQANLKNASIETHAEEIISSRTITLIILEFIIIIGLYFTISKIFKNISVPIKKVLEVSKEISKGHLKARTNIRSKDEVGVMAETIDKMASDLDNYSLLLQSIANGKVDVCSQAFDSEDVLAISLNEITNTLTELTKEINSLTQSALSGNLKHRGDESKFSGGYKELLRGINKTLDAVINPITEGSSVLKKMSEGDITNRVNGDYKGDHQLIKNSINHLSESFTSVLSLIGDSINSTASAVTQILASSEEISTGVQEQSLQTNEVSTAMEEMSKTIFETTRNIIKTNELAKESKSIAANGQAIIESTISGMKQIELVVKQASEIIIGLSNRSTKIGGIVKVINEIADQTNLLALNAAIEAARAGEHGRGFAIVADEVKKLADRTSSSTSEIVEMINSIQSDSQNAAKAIELGTSQVSVGMENSINAGNSMHEIVKSSDLLLEASSQVAAASEEQSAAVEQISKNVDSINSVANLNAAGIKTVADSTNDLMYMVENLQKLIGKFKISDRQNEDWSCEKFTKKKDASYVN
ncbi:MAG: methyl-accepting chemotaxis protein [Ignavibacteriae bacterium]|nr:methyl-accepting chemotaxis protein [Ignavibacteriota bacterium]